METMKQVRNSIALLSWLGSLTRASAQTPAPSCASRFTYDKDATPIVSDILIQFFEATRDDLTVQFLSELSAAIPGAYDKVAGTICDPCTRNIDSVTLLPETDPTLQGIESNAYVLARLEVSHNGGCNTIFDSSFNDDVTIEETASFEQDCGSFTETNPGEITGEACCSTCSTIAGVVSTIDFADQLGVDMDFSNRGFVIRPLVFELQSFPEQCSGQPQEDTVTLYLGADYPIPTDDYDYMFGNFIALYNVLTAENCFAQRIQSIVVGEDFGSPDLDLVRRLQSNEAPCSEQHTCLQIEVQKRCSSQICPSNGPLCQLFDGCEARRDLLVTRKPPDERNLHWLTRVLHSDQYFSGDCVCAVNYEETHSFQPPTLEVFSGALNAGLQVKGLDPVELFDGLGSPPCPPFVFNCPSNTDVSLDMVFNITIDSSSTQILAEKFSDLLTDFVPRAYDVVAGIICDPCGRRLEILAIGWSANSTGYADVFEVFVAMEQTGSCDNIFDTSADIATTGDAILFEETCGAFHDSGTCCCGCSSLPSLLSTEDFREQLHLVIGVPIANVSSARDVGTTPTPVPTESPTICFDDDIPCPSNPSEIIFTNILVEVGTRIELLHSSFPSEFLNAFTDVYNAVAGAICDECGRRIVDGVVPTFPSDFISTVRRSRKNGGRSLQKSIQAPNRIILEVMVEQSGDCQRAFDGAMNVIDYNEIVLYDEACGTFYNPFGSSGETCCCLCTNIGAGLGLSREDFREALASRLQVPILSVSEVERDEEVCADEISTTEADFVFDLVEPLRSPEEERLFLEAFISAYNQACLDNCVHIELRDLSFVDSLNRRTNRNLQASRAKIRGIKSSKCRPSVCPVNNDFNNFRRLAEEQAMNAILLFRLYGNEAPISESYNIANEASVDSRNLQVSSFVDQCLCRVDFDAPVKTYELPTTEQTTELMNENLQDVNISNITAVADEETPSPTSAPVKGKGKGRGKGKGKGITRGMRIGNRYGKQRSMGGSWMSPSRKKGQWYYSMMPKMAKSAMEFYRSNDYRHRRRPVPSRTTRRPPTPMYPYSPQAPRKHGSPTTMGMNYYSGTMKKSPDVFRKRLPTREGDANGKSKTKGMMM